MQFASSLGLRRLLCWFMVLPQLGWSYDLDPTNQDQVKQIAQKVVYKMMEFYPGNKTGGIPGLFGDPYYWWEAGAAFGSLIDYWHYTGDAGYNNVTMQAMMWQVGPYDNYMPPNQSKSLGNDDQCFWGLSAMAAAEKNFPNPPSNQPQWLALAQGVFNSQALRWDTDTCGGGLKWQIYAFNAGYTYKNSVSNGCFFHLAARLARYTGNDTYTEWANRAYDWVHTINLLDGNYTIYDGFDSTNNCTQARHNEQWTYNNGLFVAGAAYMYNMTNGNETWKTRIDGLLNSSQIFFNNSIMYERQCETTVTCDTDQESFKAYFARFLALTIKLAPYTESIITPWIQTSSIAAAKQCSSGDDGNTCGLKWTTNGVWDGKYGVGEQMAALEVIQSNLIDYVDGPVTHNTGGTSKGDPSAGTSGDTDPTSTEDDKPITTGDRVGAGFSTAIVVCLILGGTAWMII